MENEARKTNDEAFYRLCEEGMSPEQVRVRKLLLGLPRQCCPEGFEIRLQHRVREMESGARPLRERYSWGLGLAGLGLGLGTALLVSVIVFDFSFVPKSNSLPAAPVTVTTSTPQAVTPPETNPFLASSPQQGVTEPEAVPVEDQADQMAAAKDSNTSDNPPAALPEDLYHMVGGSGR